MRERVPFGALALAVVGLVAVGCGGGDADPVPTPEATLDPAATAFPTNPPAGAEGEFHFPTYANAGVAPAWLTTLRPQYANEWPYMSPYQRELLSDGDLTFAEYEAAVLAEVQCVKDAGFELRTEPHYDELERRFAWGFSTRDVPALVAASDPCNREYTGLLPDIWQAIHARTPAETAEASAFLWGCLQDAGFADAPQPGTPAFAEWFGGVVTDPARNAQASDCLHQTQTRFGFIPQ